MKTLIAMRHAKSDWADSSLSDFDRPLNPRGNKDAPEMGRRLNKHDLKPDMVLHSAALRTTQTAEHIAGIFKMKPSSVVPSKKLYLADPEALLHSLQETPSETVNTLMIIGHNPGISTFCERLTNDDVGDMVTASTAIISFEIEDWDCVTWGLGKLLNYDYPKRDAI